MPLHRLAQGRQGGIAVIRHHLIFYHTPDALDGVEVGRVFRQEQQRHAREGLQPLHDSLGGMGRGMVEDDPNVPRRTRQPDLLQASHEVGRGLAVIEARQPLSTEDIHRAKGLDARVVGGRLGTRKA